MARYRLHAPHFIDDKLLPSDDVIETVRPPTPDMEPLDEEAVGHFLSMSWARRGWSQAVTAESLPGGRHRDGSPALLNRPENLGRPLTYNPPQPDFSKEIPEGTAREPIPPREPPSHYWLRQVGAFGPNDPVLPFGSTPGSKGA